MGDVLLVGVERPYVPRRLPEGAGGGTGNGHSGAAERTHIEAASKERYSEGGTCGLESSRAEQSKR